MTGCDRPLATLTRTAQVAAVMVGFKAPGVRQLRHAEQVDLVGHDQGTWLPGDRTCLVTERALATRTSTAVADRSGEYQRGSTAVPRSGRVDGRQAGLSEVERRAGISSRSQLYRVLPSDPDPVPPR
jgi:hypothetical protein